MPNTLDPTVAPESEQAGGIHGNALVAGAVIGTVVAALLTGSFILVLVLGFGAVVGAMAFGGIAALRSNRRRSGDHPMPTLSANTSPDAQRREAGGASPEPSA